MNDIDKLKRGDIYTNLKYFDDEMTSNYDDMIKMYIKFNDFLGKLQGLKPLSKELTDSLLTFARFMPEYSQVNEQLYDDFRKQIKELSKTPD